MERKEYDYCLRCGRKLKNPVAREKGYGAVCEKKMAIESTKHLFSKERKAQKKVRVYKVTYQWQDRKVLEEVPAMSVKDAEEMVLQKMNGTYTKEELDDAQFHIISIE